jgi:hypothetical protein
MIVTPTVDIWWTKGREASPVSDATIHCRAASVTAGVPVTWRSGARKRLLNDVLAKYPRSSSALRRGSFGDERPHLSLSDSGTHLAVGVGRHVAVGIDIERHRPVDDPLQTLQRLGLGLLAARLGELAPVSRNRAFLHLWTAFEAFLKLERLKWDHGAERFSTLAPHWLVAASGQVEFRGAQRTGLYFWHGDIAGEIVIAAATPKPAVVSLTRISVASRARISANL